jgi:AcrR family transcriptional regulator
MVADPSAPTPATRITRMSAEARRTSIVAAATELFATVGYQRCRMSDVAARIGVTEPVVFQNFGSKALLYAAVLEHVATEMATRLRTASQHAGSVSAALHGLLSPRHLDRMHTSGAPGTLFADAAWLTTEPAVTAAARRGMRRIADALADLLSEGQANGEIRASLDPATGAWWLLSVIASQQFRATLMPRRVRLDPELAAIALAAITTTD